MKKLCTILARGGSKGVLNKNIRPLAGKPLLVHTIAQAQKSGLFDVIAVSSDSDSILSVAASAGILCLVKRPESMAGDSAPKLPAIQHCLLEAEKKNSLRFDVVCDLDPTSPFRLVSDIAACVNLIHRPDVDNVITAAAARKSPYFNLIETDSHGYAKLSKPLPQSVSRRQDSPKCFDMNASIYVWHRDNLLNSSSIFQDKTVVYEMPRERSIEIDTEFDFDVAEFFSAKGGL